jgi:hypothetical protein
MTVSARHFNALASILRDELKVADERQAESVARVASAVADMCSRENYGFQRGRFDAVVFGQDLTRHVRW